MADISIIKLKVRRGTNSQRQRIILEQGELGFTTDTQRLFIGNGFLSGGVVAGNLIHGPLQTAGSRTSLNNAVQGDIVNEGGYLYQLSGTNYSQTSAWGFIGTKPDNTSVEYNGSRQLALKNNGISGTKFASTAAYNMGGLVATSASGLSANVDRVTLTITASNQLSVLQINQNNIASSALGDGLTGGNGALLRVNAGPGFSFNSGVLSLTSVPSSSVGLSSISSDALGDGLSLSSGKVVANIQTVDNVTIQNVAGDISLKNIIGAGSSQFSNFTFNEYGQITSLSSSITQSFTGNETTSPFLSVFNGSPEQTTYTNQTLISAISGNGTSNVNIQLSSAGFVVIPTSYGSGQYAIPVFKF
jgi:hypothetical protein